MQLSKTLFLRRKNINNLSELKQYFSTYYYLRIPGAKEQYTKDLNSEELSVFNWMYKKYVDGKFKTLSELFSPVDSFFSREIKPEQIWNDAKKEVIKEAIKKHKSEEVKIESPLSNKQSFTSTRHKVNPETTTTPHPSFVNNMNVKYEVVNPDNAGENLLFLLLSGEDEKQIFKDFNISEQDIQHAKKDVEESFYDKITKEAKERGFGKGCIYKSFLGELVKYTDFSNFREGYNSLSMYGSHKYLDRTIKIKDCREEYIGNHYCAGDIYRDGQWVEIIKVAYSETPPKDTDFEKVSEQPYINPKQLKAGESSKIILDELCTGIVEPLKNIGKKESEGKLFYEFDWEFIEAAAKRMQNNKGDKYPRWNWKQPTSIEDLKQAIQRHHMEVMKGNYKDGEEEFGHVVSYFCNSMMIFHQLKNFPQIKQAALAQ